MAMCMQYATMTCVLAIGLAHAQEPLQSLGDPFVQVTAALAAQAAALEAALRTVDDVENVLSRLTVLGPADPQAR